MSILSIKNKKHPVQDLPVYNTSSQENEFYDSFDSEEEEKGSKFGGCGCCCICLTILAAVIGAGLIGYKVITKNTCNWFGVSTARSKIYFNWLMG